MSADSDVGHGPCRPNTDPSLIHHHRLSPAEARQVFDLAHWCRRRWFEPAALDFLDEVAVVSADLPRALRAMASVARLDERKHAVLVSGNIIDEETLVP